jgi:broad specificity phosphatase PhoE
VTLYFVRHGESTWNVEGRFQGQLDAPLSGVGVLQAQAVAQRIARETPPAAIVTSPLSRARRTAEIIGACCGIPVSVDERLIEICHGQWQGVLETDVVRRWPALHKQWHEAPVTVTFPDGESLLHVQARFDSFLADAFAMPSPLLVCTHDVLVRLAALWARHEPLERFFEWKTENAAITEIEVQQGEPRLVRHNDVGHLDGLRSDVAHQAL